ncbi:MAG TPA: 2'-5' RNA ligase family protein [Burkholderiaceae bacterium]|nr:2'-5' RNA ligase family protein [Burkholderiaceae bacterium]
MAKSAFVVKVPQAELLVGDLRHRFDATAILGVPAHITVLFPFMDPESITPAIVENVQQAFHRMVAFPFALKTVGRFPTTAYLVPEPSAPFVAMTEALVAAFPSFKPYEGEHLGVIPHLTVAHGNASEADSAEAELGIRLGSFGPVVAECASVVLLENSSGRWKEMHAFPLKPAGA